MSFRDNSRTVGGNSEDGQSSDAVDMDDESSTNRFHIGEALDHRFARHGSGEGSNCSSTLPLPSRNSSGGIRENSESFSEEELMRAADAEDEVFVDAIADFDHSPYNMLDRAGTLATPAATAAPTSLMYRDNGNFGLLERCGRWLMSIPRDDVVALQSTAEYREFLNAFDRLGEAHRRTVMLERRHLLETEDATLLASSGPTDNVGNENSREQVVPSSDLTSVHALTAGPFLRYSQYSQYPLALVADSRRRHFSFLQHLAVDDILLRTFEYIDCSSLVRTGTTCHRFHELTTRSAEQRVASLADGRLLRSAMKMLRAQEQIEGVNVFEESGQYVPIPMLGLRRRIKVSGAGDAEFNGIYFCTGSNGNGFLFTKPRVPERRVSGHNRNNFGRTVVGQAPLARAQLQHPIDLEGVENPVRELVGVANAVVLEDDEDDNDQRDGGVDVLFGDEPNRSRLLRCVISKRFSNEVREYCLKQMTDYNYERLRLILFLFCSF